MSLRDLCKQCESFEVSTSDFASIVRNGLNLLGSLQRDFATEFDVNESTISRWAKGSAKPLPRFQKLVVKSILKKAKKLANLYEESTEENSNTTSSTSILLDSKPKKIAGPFLES